MALEPTCELVKGSSNSFSCAINRRSVAILLALWAMPESTFSRKLSILRV